jgi:hypothetical protein
MYLNNCLQIYELHSTYYIKNTLVNFHVHLIRNSCHFDSKLISSTSIERFMVSAGVFLKYLVFWNAAHCLLPSSSRHFEVWPWLIIQGQGVQD